MTELEISVYHELLFDYLLKEHEKDNNFLFQVRRSDRNNRLSNRYWFNGTDKKPLYIETSFWEYRDDDYKTPTIRLVSGYNEEGWTLELVAKEKEEKKCNYPAAFGILTIALTACKTDCPFLTAESIMERIMANCWCSDLN